MCLENEITYTKGMHEGADSEIQRVTIKKCDVNYKIYDLNSLSSAS